LAQIVHDPQRALRQRNAENLNNSETSGDAKARFGAPRHRAPRFGKGQQPAPDPSKNVTEAASCFKPITGCREGSMLPAFHPADGRAAACCSLSIERMPGDQHAAVEFEQH
jgi:hypothetical protein